VILCGLCLTGRSDRHNACLLHGIGTLWGKGRETIRYRYQGET
jgi:hypothetical protein